MPILRITDLLKEILLAGESTVFGAAQAEELPCETVDAVSAIRGGQRDGVSAADPFFLPRRTDRQSRQAANRLSTGRRRASPFAWTSSSVTASESV